MASERLRVLLIDDDQDDYVLVRSLLAETLPLKYDLEWVATYDVALEAVKRNQHDVYLLDYRLGERNGLELLQWAIENGCKVPIILLTGHGDYEVDVEAMKAGAADYLVKGHINSLLLERSIRYARERKRAEEALRESERRLRSLSSKLLTAQEEERKRIAGEIHDSISSSLSAVKYGLENALQQTEQGKTTPESLKALISMTQNAVEESRRIMTDLRPSILDDLGIVSTIGWFCRGFEKTYSNIRIEKGIALEESEVPEPLKIVIFRVMQEAFHNIAKHGKAEQVNLGLGKRDRVIELTIKDNGVGFDLDSANFRKGLGLTSMRERAELSGGSFKIESIRGAGTMIRASWPLDK